MKKRLLFLTAFLLLIDIFTKLLININFNFMETRVLISNFFAITKVYNYGAAWNIFTGARFLLILIGIASLVGLYFYQKHFTDNLRNLFAFAFVYSGIIGNLLNRMIFGYVIDFFDFTIFGYDYPVFNFADICIVSGIILMIIAIIKKEDCNEVKSSK